MIVLDRSDPKPLQALTLSNQDARHWIRYYFEYFYNIIQEYEI